MNDTTQPSKQARPGWRKLAAIAVAVTIVGTSCGTSVSAEDGALSGGGDTTDEQTEPEPAATVAPTTAPEPEPTLAPTPTPEREVEPTWTLLSEDQLYRAFLAYKDDRTPAEVVGGCALMVAAGIDVRSIPFESVVAGVSSELQESLQIWSPVASDWGGWTSLLIGMREGTESLDPALPELFYFVSALAFAEEQGADLERLAEISLDVTEAECE